MKAPLQPTRTFGSAAGSATAQRKGLKTITDNRPTMVAQRKLQGVVQAKGGVIQAVQVGAHDVTFTPGYCSWKQDEKGWHINWALGEEGVYHVTNESTNPKTHYFFKVDAGIISDATAPTGKKGRKNTSKKFSALPASVKDYITSNINHLVV